MEDYLKENKEKVIDEFDEFLKENFEDPEHSDVFILKQTKKKDKKKES